MPVACVAPHCGLKAASLRVTATLGEVRAQRPNALRRLLWVLQSRCCHRIVAATRCNPEVEAHAGVTSLSPITKLNDIGECTQVQKEHKNWRLTRFSTAKWVQYAPRPWWHYHHNLA